MTKEKPTITEALEKIKIAMIQFAWLKWIFLTIVIPAMTVGAVHVINADRYATKEEYVSKKDFYILFTIHTNSMEEMMSKVLVATHPEDDQVLSTVQDIADRNKALIEILTDSNYKGIYSGHETYDRVYNKMKVIQDRKIKDSIK